MQTFRKIAGTVSALVMMILFTNTVASQDMPSVGGAEGNALSMLDDLTSSLLADDPSLSNGTDIASSLLEGLPSSDGPGGDPIGTESPDDPSNQDPALPVDGGLSLLLAAGAAYGGSRLRRGKRMAKA